MFTRTVVVHELAQVAERYLRTITDEEGNELRYTFLYSVSSPPPGRQNMLAAANGYRLRAVVVGWLPPEMSYRVFDHRLIAGDGDAKLSRGIQHLIDVCGFSIGHAHIYAGTTRVIYRVRFQLPDGQLHECAESAYFRLHRKADGEFDMVHYAKPEKPPPGRRRLYYAITHAWLLDELTYWNDFGTPEVTIEWIGPEVPGPCRFQYPNGVISIIMPRMPAVVYTSSRA